MRRWEGPGGRGRQQQACLPRICCLPLPIHMSPRDPCCCYFRSNLVIFSFSWPPIGISGCRASLRGGNKLRVVTVCPPVPAGAGQRSFEQRSPLIERPAGSLTPVKGFRPHPALVGPGPGPARIHCMAFQPTSASRSSVRGAVCGVCWRGCDKSSDGLCCVLYCEEEEMENKMIPQKIKRASRWQSWFHYVAKLHSIQSVSDTATSSRLYKRECT